jgi:hypothetical protein
MNICTQHGELACERGFAMEAVVLKRTLILGNCQVLPRDMEEVTLIGFSGRPIAAHVMCHELVEE